MGTPQKQPIELAATRHHAANCDPQEDSSGVDPPWNRRRCRCRICRLLHGPKAHCRQADASFSPEQKGLECALEGNGMLDCDLRDWRWGILRGLNMRRCTK